MADIRKAWRFRSPLTIILCQQLLFWLSVIALAIAGFTLNRAPDDNLIKASAILSIISAFSTLSYIYLHWLISRQYLEDDDSDLPFKRPGYVAQRVAAIAPIFWLLTAAWGLVLSARRAVCLPGSSIRLGAWQAGDACIAHRAGVCVSILLLIVSCVLFAEIATDHHCYESWLFGIRKVKQLEEAKPRDVLPASIPRGHSKTSSTSSLSSSTNPRPSYTGYVPASQMRAVPGLQFNPYMAAPPSYGAYSPQTSRSSTMVSNGPYRSHSRSQSLTSIHSQGYYPPMQPASFIMADSAWRAIHPPAFHFGHVSQPQRAYTPGGLVRSIPPSPNHTRGPGLYASSQSSRSHSRAGSLNRMYIAPNGARLRSSPSNQSLSSGSSSSGGPTSQPYRPGMYHKRAASDNSGSIAELREARAKNSSQLNLGGSLARK